MRTFIRESEVSHLTRSLGYVPTRTRASWRNFSSDGMSVPCAFIASNRHQAPKSNPNIPLPVGVAGVLLHQPLADLARRQLRSLRQLFGLRQLIAQRPGLLVLRHHPGQKRHHQTLQVVQRQGVKIDRGWRWYTWSGSSPSRRGKPPESTRRNPYPDFLTAYPYQRRPSGPSPSGPKFVGNGTARLYTPALKVLPADSGAIPVLPEIFHREFILIVERLMIANTLNCYLGLNHARCNWAE